MTAGKGMNAKTAKVQIWEHIRPDGHYEKVHVELILENGRYVALIGEQYLDELLTNGGWIRES